MDVGIDITRSPGGSQERVDLLADEIPEECDEELCLSLISGLGCHDEETGSYMLQEDTIGEGVGMETFSNAIHYDGRTFNAPVLYPSSSSPQIV